MGSVADFDSFYHGSPSSYMGRYESGLESTLGRSHSISSGTRVDWDLDLNSSFNNGDTETMSFSSQIGDELQELEPENSGFENLCDMVIDDLLLEEEPSLVVGISESEEEIGNLSEALYDDLFYVDLFDDSDLEPWVHPWVDSRRGLDAVDSRGGLDAVDSRRGLDAAERAGESLPLVALRKDDLKDGAGVCAICVNEVVEGEMVKRLPCSHYYHGECILPWLRIKNTCPVCRYELPLDGHELSSDDQEHESWNWQVLEPPLLPFDLQDWI